MRRISLVLRGNCLREGRYIFLRQCSVNPFYGVREDNTTGSERPFPLGVRRSLSLPEKTH